MTASIKTKERPVCEFGSPSEAIQSAQELLKSNKYRKALVMLQSANKKWEKNVPIAGLMAETFANCGEYKKAADIYSALLKTENHPNWVFVGYANVMEKTQKHDEAIKQFFSALDFEYSNPVALRVVRLLKYSAHPKDDAKKLYKLLKKSVDKNGELGKQLCYLGDHAFGLNDALSAVAFYDFAIAENDTYKRAHRRKIKVLIRLRDFNTARACIDDWGRANEGDNAFNRFREIIDFNNNILPYMKVLGNIFVPGYYKNQYQLQNLTNSEAFSHFINIGLEKENNPNPWFDSEYFVREFGEVMKESEIPLISFLRLENSLPVKPGKNFDPKYYRATYPDLRDLPSAFEHYCSYGHAEGRSPVKRELPNVVLEEFNEMVALEPKLVGAKHALGTIVRYPRVMSSIFVPRIIRERVKADVKAVVCVPFISHGGADLVATVALKALQKRYGVSSVLLIATESKATDLECWFDEETPIVFLDQECGYESLEDKVLTLHNVIGQFTPDTILNVNSHLCWEMYREYGKQLASVTSLRAYLFCYDYNKERNRVGYITEYLSDTIDILDDVFVDNKTIVSDIAESYMFSEKNQSKINHIYTPYLDVMNQKTDTVADGGILWIGRLSLQKRPDILVQVAESMPSRDFYVYGALGNSSASQSIINNRIPNIHFMGTYDLLSEVDLSKYSLFLHTSEWEGLPTILITMMAVGVPIVTSLAGGVEELVDESNGWVVDNCDDVDEYCRQITLATLNYPLAIEKSMHGIEKIASQFSWSNYEERLDELSFFDSCFENKKMQKIA